MITLITIALNSNRTIVFPLTLESAMIGSRVIVKAVEQTINQVQEALYDQVC